MSRSGSQYEATSASFAQRCAREALRYLDRRLYWPLPPLPAPNPDLDLVVVIPALAEPDLVTTLESVAAAVRPGCAVEIAVIVNAPDNASADLRRRCAECLTEARVWAAKSHDECFACQVLDCRDLPADQAGVGLARKIGMDTALARLVDSDSHRGVIVSLDADCQVAPDYLTAVEQYFRATPGAVGATIYFEHPLNEAPAATRAAIVDYELHLRCYRQGLEFAGSAYAFHKVGSAFAVRSEIYAQEGGMNRRPAGEDFYFINKMLKRGVVGQINDTTVYPSARISDRVPFGTGAALQRSANQPVTTYAPAVYRELQAFHGVLEALVRDEAPVPCGYAAFLEAMAFDTWFAKTRANVASTQSLAAQLGRWLDSFRTMKFIHWLSESRYPRVPAAEAAAEILGWSGLKPASDAEGMLKQFRQFERKQSK